MGKNSILTVEIDIGNRYSNICTVDEEDGEVVILKETRIKTTQRAVKQYFASRTQYINPEEKGEQPCGGAGRPLHVWHLSVDHDRLLYNCYYHPLNFGLF